MKAQRTGTETATANSIKAKRSAHTNTRKIVRTTNVAAKILSRTETRSGFVASRYDINEKNAGMKLAKEETPAVAAI